MEAVRMVQNAIQAYNEKTTAVLPTLLRKSGVQGQKTERESERKKGC